jgi:hypothetical protein
VQVTLPFAAGWFDDCVVSVVTLFVELAILPCAFGQSSSSIFGSGLGVSFGRWFQSAPLYVHERFVSVS